jgi:Bacterial Ig domain/Lysyl oxidase
VKLGAGIVLALAVLAASAGPAHALPNEPDLVIRLPGEPSAARVAPVFVDAFEEPGRLLYRFDAIIANEGGTLDLFRSPGGGVQQAVWPGGVPATPPKPDVTPSGPEVVDRSNRGAGFEYAYEKTHEHFHISAAAQYELQPEGGAVRASDKVGFCMFDSYEPEPSDYFRFEVQGAAGETWCAFNRPSATTVRMGLSPGGEDMYSAARERQWVDISGLEPGPAVVRGKANPLLCVLESDETNNSTSVARQIPGVRVAAAAGSTANGTAVALGLSGTVVAPDVPARRSKACAPSPRLKSCYVWASAAGPLRFDVAGAPAHGSVSLGPGGSGLQAVATYTPAAGFTGEDSFTYTATDARGLTSKPATVRVSVAPPAAAPPAITPVAARLSRVRVVRRNGRWRVQLQVSAPARLSGQLERRARRRFRALRRLRGRDVAAGPARMALGRLAPGRYRVRIVVDGRRARTVSFRVRRR